PVKIAILDTGVDLPKPPCDKFQDRIAGYKDWVDLDDTIQQDLDGHGTHSTALLMKVAPNATIYIERVFKHGDHRKGMIPKQEINQNIEKAIRHAVDVWNVDIITMSFGFDESVSSIDKAICYAKQKDTILLSAASNEGGNADVSWPARMDEVICIHASDGVGNKAKFTPDSHRNKDNFIILGEDVMSSWPMHLNQGHEVRKSGTSCATPIAAGIAAIMLELAGLHLYRNSASFSIDEVEHFWKLKTIVGMREVFALMAGERDTYDYIRPWRLLQAKKGYKMDSVMDMILQRLRDRT
ncbi:subtilisin-like protein, partial [Hyaloscypha bicolor E]